MNIGDVLSMIASIKIGPIVTGGAILLLACLELLFVAGVHEVASAWSKRGAEVISIMAIFAMNVGIIIIYQLVNR